jgi:hypothetical protein
MPKICFISVHIFAHCSLSVLLLNWCAAVLNCCSAASKKADKTAAVTLRESAEMDLDDDTTATTTAATTTADATRLPLAYLALAAALAPSLVSWHTLIDCVITLLSIIRTEHSAVACVSLSWFREYQLFRTLVSTVQHACMACFNVHDAGDVQSLLQLAPHHIHNSAMRYSLRTQATRHRCTGLIILRICATCSHVCGCFVCYNVACARMHRMLSV